MRRLIVFSFALALAALALRPLAAAPPNTVLPWQPWSDEAFQQAARWP